MPSILEGYTYDVFISYRQKDNKHDGWVTEFVNQLKGELGATFKEDISIYFDENPHDGLLETHSVDKSLENKLKCLIFIPIISHTYCDPKSFAWQHEFCAFNKIAKEDRFGRDIKLSSGNVSSRILPVKIHDLDPEDKALLETELGGVLRSVEFIYKSAGVNRPLRANEDHPQDNLNKTYYRDQINKVANAVKEIISSLKKQSQHPEDAAKEDLKVKSGSKKSLKTKIVVGSIIALAIIVLSILLIPNLIKSEVQLEKSIAVLPFINDSPSDSNQYFINGIMEEILNNLQKIKEFRVLSRTSTSQYKGSDNPALPEIAKKLNVNYIVEGSGQKYGNKLVLRVQLIAGKKEKHLWGESYNREIKQATDIISLQSEIAQLIASALKATMSPEEKQLVSKIPTTNLTAYDFFQRGRDEHSKYWLDNTKTKALDNAISYYKLALKSDSTFAQAYTGLAMARSNSYWSNVWTKLTFSENDMKILQDSITSLVDKAFYYNNNLEEAILMKGWSYDNPDMAIEEYKKALDINPNYGLAYYCIADVFLWSKNETVEGIKNKLKAIELERGPLLPRLLKELGTLYETLGFNENAIEIYNQLFQLTKDTLKYFENMSGPYYAAENWEESIRWAKKILEKDPNNSWAHSQLAGIYSFLGKDDLFTYHAERIKELEYVPTDIELYKGFIQWESGNKVQADAILNKIIDFSDKLITSGIGSTSYLLDLAGIFSLKGELKKATEYLNKINEDDRWFLQRHVIIYMENSPLFQNIRSNERFQEILETSKSNWQKEHEKVRIWLEENNLLKI